MNTAHKRVLFVIAEGFEQSELDIPVAELRERGVAVEIAALDTTPKRSWHNNAWGRATEVDVTLDCVDAGSYDAIVLPGGFIGPHSLRLRPQVMKLIKEFYWSGRIVAAIGHACSLLIEADIIKGHRVTAYPSLRRDMINGGALWTDAPAVSDRHVVTGRDSASLKEFLECLLEEMHDTASSKRIPEFAVVHS